MCELSGIIAHDIVHYTHVQCICCLISHLQVIGLTFLNPDTIDPVPTSMFDLMQRKDYWLFWNNDVYHDGQEQHLNISTEDLKVDDSIGWCITRDGDWEIYINGQKRAVGWRNVPTDKLLWGVVDICGSARTIQSEFYCGELYSA